jgi:hypothetical protein
MGLLSSAKLVGDALHRASPDAERLSHLQDTHTFREQPSHPAFGRAVDLRAAEFHALGDDALETYRPLERRRPRTGQGQIVGVNNAYVSRELGARFNPPRAGLPQTSPWLTPRGRSRQRGRAPFHCYARAASGQATAVPASSLMKLSLLRARRERPCHGRAAEQRDERAAFHSITSSASSTNESGIVSPIALAALRLTINS